MKKKSSPRSKDKNSKSGTSNRTSKKSSGKSQTAASKKSRASKKSSTVASRSTGKKKPASKKPAARKPASKKPAARKPAGKKPAARKPATNGKTEKSRSSRHAAVEKKHAKEPQRNRILPADTPFPVKFTARSNRAIEKYVYNKKSSIHGMGAFAKTKIKKGAYIGSYEGIPTLDDDIYVLWVEQDNGSWRGIDGKNELRYLNHSSYPNAEWNANDLFASRTIEPHEELTFHYGDEWDDVE